MINRSSRWIAIALIAALCAVSLPAFAFGKTSYKRNRNRYGSSNRPKVNSGQVTAAQRALSAAAAQLKQAKSKFKSETLALTRVRLQVRKDHDADPSLVAARRRWDESKKELAAVSTPILQKLARSDSEYRSAVSERDSLKRNLDTFEPSEVKDREGQLKRYSSLVAQVSHLEKTALFADPQAAALQRQVDEEDASVRDLVKRKEGAVESDSHLIHAQQNVRAAKQAIDSAESKMAGAKQKLASAQRSYQQQLAAASRYRGNSRGRSHSYRRN